MYFVLIQLLLLLEGAVAQQTGTINDIEHIVVFMQENRPFDHYYGSLHGVRGFNDRAAPLLPNGRSPFYQPVTPPKKHSVLCGCADACSLNFTKAGADMKQILEGPDCPGLAKVLKGAVPTPISVAKGGSCHTLLMQVYNATSIEGVNVAQYLSAPPVCKTGAVVTDSPTAAAGFGAKRDDGKDYLVPFPLMFDRTAASCMPAPEMAFDCNTKMFNNGNCDGWNTQRDPGYGMAFFNRTDLPYYYALAESFTIGDQYFQSTFTATCPNREHLFSGSNGLSVKDSGMCLLDDAEPSGMTWETMGETLQNHNISWKLYQEQDNFDDNGFAWFEAFRNSTKGEPLFDKGMARTDDFVQAFADDVGNDALPQVSWLVGPAHLSEHASNHPADGEDLSARILQILAKPENKAVYAKTAFILNYDEGGQFFDHHWPPTPPLNDQDGLSTVTTEGELTLQEEFGIPAGRPIGLGWRVPLILISPWTRGDYVYSEVSDHTSVIQFIEKRFGVECPNISPWRRAVTSDLTSAFDFANPDYSWPASFPDTSGNINASKQQCDNNPPPTVPTTQVMPRQAPGTKRMRALPYIFNVRDWVSPANSTIELYMAHAGAPSATAGVFYVYDRSTAAAIDRGAHKFTVEGGKSLHYTWLTETTDNAYELSMHGPNGFVRQFKGNSGTAATTALLAYSPASREVQVVMSNAKAGTAAIFTITDNAYGLGGPWTVQVSPGKTVTHKVNVSAAGNWYDLSVTTGTTGTFERRFMGRMETGETTTSDPAMARGVPGLAGDIWSQAHPPVPVEYTMLSEQKWDAYKAKECDSRRAQQKDLCWTDAN